MHARDIKHVQEAVLSWYVKHGRHDLPWRNLPEMGIDTPYGVLVSELMLQQTQVERVIPKFAEFVRILPTVQNLAKSPSSQVIRLWSGLGYNRRAILLQRAAQEIVALHRGVIPSNTAQLKQLSGVGAYTAGAIASFGYNLPTALIDTNIERFYELLFFGYNKPSAIELEQMAKQFIPSNQSREWHSALMDLMTHVRKIRSPRDQQTELISILNITLSWKLPELSNQPLSRPHQPKFEGSPRYYRGKIIAFLNNSLKHEATIKELTKILQEMPPAYNLPSLLEQLQKDGLVEFLEPLGERSIVRLPHR